MEIKLRHDRLPVGESQDDIRVERAKRYFGRSKCELVRRSGWKSEAASRPVVNSPGLDRMARDARDAILATRGPRDKHIA
jgi:hypothetical protein